VVLTAGASGLIVAGLLAAAMSSLSSGLNSSSAVITVDFLERFGGHEKTAAGDVRRSRFVAWSVGLVVILLSTIVGVVSGNLLEIAYKVTNLLVAPLFGLFFMALFVRWSTSFGTVVGACFGVATVVAINYGPEITGRAGISFLWAMPLGLLIQVVTGSLASLLPIGPKRPADSAASPAP
jgi:Na+/proline symporter